MRVGFNPNKDKELKKSDYFHQVIIPVYIPNQEGYFRDALRILRLCLESLIKTCHSKTFISVIDNGSCDQTALFLNQLKLEGKIQELIQTSNIGKLNAIFKGLSGHKFELITITDSDALFLNDWQKSTYQVFENFPRAGAVSPVPSSKSFSNHTANILASNLFSKRLKFTDVKNQNGLKAFAISIGNPNFYNNIHLRTYLTISNLTFRAVVGAGHFVCTYRGEVFRNVNEKFSTFSMGGDSEERFLDKAVVKKGLWRLATQDNYAFHLGNAFENWMDVEFKTIKNENSIVEGVELPPIKRISIFTLISSIFIKKIMARKSLRSIILHYKGLSKIESLKY